MGHFLLPVLPACPHLDLSAVSVRAGPIGDSFWGGGAPRLTPALEAATPMNLFPGLREGTVAMSDLSFLVSKASGQPGSCGELHHIPCQWLGGTRVGFSKRGEQKHVFCSVFFDWVKFVLFVVFFRFCVCVFYVNFFILLRISLI